MPTKANFPSMRRLVIPIAALIALLAIPARRRLHAGRLRPAGSDVHQPVFAPLKFKAARYITPYDVMESPADKAQWDAWYSAATAATRRSSSPSSTRTAATRAAERAVGRRVHEGAQGVQGGLSEGQRDLALERGQPLPPHDRRQRPGQPVKIGSLTGSQADGAYYKAARKIFKGSKCTIVGLDILDEQNVKRTVKYLQSFLRHASPDPKIIGFHNYSDTNRFSTTRTKRVLAAFHGKVWLTETGGIVKLGRSFPASTSRASKALGCMFTLAKVQLAHPAAVRLPVQSAAPIRPPPTSTPA